MSPDLRQATVFVEPLGAGLGGADPDEVVKGLNRVAKFLRGRLGPRLDAKFTPDLKFRHDESFEAAASIDRLFDDPRVKADLIRDPQGDPDGTDDGA
jgi:ribosome-binding factor A